MQPNEIARQIVAVASGNPPPLTTADRALMERYAVKVYPVGNTGIMVQYTSAAEHEAIGGLIQRTYGQRRIVAITQMEIDEL